MILQSHCSKGFINWKTNYFGKSFFVCKYWKSYATNLSHTVCFFKLHFALKFEWQILVLMFFPHTSSPLFQVICCCKIWRRNIQIDFNALPLWTDSICLSKLLISVNLREKSQIWMSFLYELIQCAFSSSFSVENLRNKSHICMFYLRALFQYDFSSSLFE